MDVCALCHPEVNDVIKTGPVDKIYRATPIYYTCTLLIYFVQFLAHTQTGCWFLWCGNTGKATVLHKYGNLKSSSLHMASTLITSHQRLWEVNASTYTGAGCPWSYWHTVKAYRVVSEEREATQAPHTCSQQMWSGSYLGHGKYMYIGILLLEGCSMCALLSSLPITLPYSFYLSLTST